VNPCVVISQPATERNPIRPPEIPLDHWGLWIMNPDEVMVICAGSREDVLSAARKLRDDLDAAAEAIVQIARSV